MVIFALSVTLRMRATRVGLHAGAIGLFERAERLRQHEVALAMTDQTIEGKGGMRQQCLHRAGVPDFPDGRIDIRRGAGRRFGDNAGFPNAVEPGAEVPTPATANVRTDAPPAPTKASIEADRSSFAARDGGTVGIAPSAASQGLGSRSSGSVADPTS
jgi:hypothetical protein